MDAETQFIDALKAAGIGPADPSEIVADDHRRRYRIEGDKPGRRNGACQLKIDGDFAVGWALSFKHGERVTWHSANGRKLDAGEREKIRKRAAAAKAKREREAAEAAADAAKRAEGLWRRAERKGSTPYLDRKGVALHGARIMRGLVVVPMRSADGKLAGLQFIAPDGEKRFLRGTAKAGTYFGIRGDAARIILCEGYATAGTLRQATGATVVAAFDAGNLAPVAEALRAKYSDAEIVIAADNDQWTKDANGSPINPGMDKARAAAERIGARVVAPQVPHDDEARRTDWNDVHMSDGLDAVRAAFDRAPDDEPPPQEPQGDWEPDYGPPPDDEPEVTTGWPFRVLGHDEGVYFFLPRATDTVVAITSGSMASPTALFRLAPLQFWEGRFGGDNQSLTKTASYAANALMDEAHRRGVFRDDRIRRIGLWIDRGRSVAHVGPHLLVEGEIVTPSDMDGGTVYAADAPEVLLPDRALSNAEAAGLRRICGRLTWATPLSGDLLAGWIVAALASGALRWRPHVWITGQSGSGKSTVMDRIVMPALGEMALRYDGGTSEAAVRQDIGNTARPVVFDEAEAEGMKDRILMDGLIMLARRASTGGSVSKGTPSGRSMRFAIRSAFCFSAINPALRKKADESRITMLALMKDVRPDAGERYKALLRDIAETITPEWSAGLLRRVIDNLPTLAANAETFVDACAAELGDRRTADQIGTMLAGLFLLTSTKRIDFDAALEWIRRHDWSLYTAGQEQSEPLRLIEYIASRTLRISAGGMREYTIGTALERAGGWAPETGHPDAECARALREIGIKLEDGRVYVANKSPRLSELLRDTEWTNWARPLSEVDGAERTGPMRFAPGLVQRAVSLPCSAFGIGPGEGDDGEEELDLDGAF